MATLEGIVANVTFQNEDSGYTVLTLQSGNEPAAVTCVGLMPTVSNGASLKMEGSWERHPRFGRQFSVERYEIVRPTTPEGIARLLGSGLIANIGPVRSKQIVDRFGLETLDILDNEPERLRAVPGIGEKTLAKIRAAWQRQAAVRGLALYLQEIGVSVSLAARIYKTYGDEARRKISADPYALIDDVWGVGFVKADAIARKMGFAHDSYKRIRAGLSFLLADAASSGGHSFLPADTLITAAAELLGVGRELVIFSLDHAITANGFVREEERVFLPHYFHAEKTVADLLRKKIDAAASTDQTRNAGPEMSGWLSEYEKKSGMRLDNLQQEAVVTAVRRPLFLLTGGPGTGKTTILQVIVSYFFSMRKTVSLAAPTGRAAARMGTIAGLPAKTIHRLLEFKRGAGGSRFERNESNPIDADVLIIDETSMIDLLLMRSLMLAVKLPTALIFVGDDNQLPSVGAGNVLADLIASGAIPHVHLTTIFRQAAASRIVTAAHEIIGGRIPKFTNEQTDDCFFVVRSDPEACVSAVVELVCRRLPSRYGFDPLADIQVLSPMHKGPLGTRNLNAVLQRALNRSDRKISWGGSDFSLGDKVLQLRNDYDRGVFNGDIGTVVSLDEEEGLAVDFGAGPVSYEIRDLDELTPAYCMSIHKSQGCEFKAVVILLSAQHFILLQRNLLYTAVTRARRLCVLVGTHKALALAVRNKSAAQRFSCLAGRLRRPDGEPIAALLRG